jgi:hypothetical protein
MQKAFPLQNFSGFQAILFSMRLNNDLEFCYSLFLACQEAVSSTAIVVRLGMGLFQDYPFRILIRQVGIGG